jgi:arabinose-5-phosphate isomerase
MDKLIVRQKESLDGIFTDLDGGKLEWLATKIYGSFSRDRNIYLCGIGKSGNMAKHMSDMLKSIGCKAFELNVANSLHGDIGCLSSNDLLLIFSKSGNTAEFLEILPYYRKKEVHIVGVFCNKNAGLAKYCDEVVTLPERLELDSGFNMFPSTSMITYTIMCNLVVARVAELRKLVLDEYGKNHPAGSIGRRIWLNLDDIMLKVDKLCIVNEDMKLIDCLLKMSENKHGYAIVSERAALLGIVTDGDIRRYITTNGLFDGTIAVGKIYNKHPFITTPETWKEDIYKSDHLLIPVVSGGEIKGLVNKNLI